MTMNDAAPQEWEIWHARFNYAGTSGYKFRPVIILGSLHNSMLAMMVTSAKNKLKLDHDHLIKDWEQAGLDKPSIARADRIIEIPREYTGTAGRIGKLSETDVRALTFILQEIANSH